MHNSVNVLRTSELHVLKGWIFMAIKEISGARTLRNSSRREMNEVGETCLTTREEAPGVCRRGRTASSRGWRLGLSSPGDPILPRRDEAGPDPPPVLRIGDTSRPAGFLWSQHPLTPKLQNRFPFRRDRAHHPFPLPASRPRPAAPGHSPRGPSGPPSPRHPQPPPPDAACSPGRSSDSCL